MSKVKNVIKGHLAHDEIERITIIDVKELDTLYAGTLENFINPCDIMKDFKKELDNKDVIKSNVNCGNQLFIFI